MVDAVLIEQVRTIAKAGPPLADAVVRIGTTVDGINSVLGGLGGRIAAAEARLNGLDAVVSKIQEEIKELELLIAYFDYCTFSGKLPFREILERCGVTTIEQLGEKKPDQLHGEVRAIAEREPQYGAVPAVRSRRVLDEIIRLCPSPSGQAGRGRQRAEQTKPS